MLLPLLAIAALVIFVALVWRRPDPHHEFMLQTVQLLDYEHRIGTPEAPMKCRAASGN